MHKFNNNPQYELLFTSKIFNEKGEKGEGEPLRFYGLKNTANYHMSRFVAGNAQNSYSMAGVTPDLLNTILDKMIESVNDKKITDVSILANNLKYRLKYPVDEDASLRMALIYSFVEGEDPDKCENHWTEWKLDKVKNDPEAYSFFLPKGIALTPAYSNYLEEISQTYFQQRREMIRTLNISAKL